MAAHRSNPNDQLKPLLTPDDVACRVRLSRRAVITGELRRVLPWIVVGGRLRLEPAALEQWLVSRAEQPAETEAAAM